MITDQSIPVRGPVICIFCGSSDGKGSEHTESARSLAKTLLAHGARIVYGGGTTGVMGELARTYVQLAGPQAVHGIIPKAMMQRERTVDEDDKQIYGNVTVVPDMHARTKLMASMVSQGGNGSGFVVLSGGYGTMAEAVECVTHKQLGFHGRPVVVYNVRGYWDYLLSWIQGAVKQGFVRPGESNLLLEAKTASQVVELLQLPLAN